MRICAYRGDVSCVKLRIATRLTFNAHVENQACKWLHRPSRRKSVQTKLIGSYLAALGFSTPANWPMR
jgi:hypothetical protein